ncbi:Variant-specific surface protein, partial [Giardia duodenalis]
VNDPAGVSIDSLCRPSSSPQAITAGCTGSDGAALTDSSTACGMCSGGFFLFRGGCYKAGEAPGSEICTKAEGGRCTTCKTDNGLFKNPAVSPTLGSECILCSDITSRDGVMGVAGCSQCTAPGSAPGSATCNTCKAGFSGASCTTPCRGSCASCDKSNENTCTSCSGSKYLKDSQCVEGASNGCGNGKYADPQSNKCISCSDPDSGITDCDTCAYDAALQGPKCLTCTSPKIVKEETNGATTCILADACTQYANDGPNFLTESSKACILCNNNTDTSTTGNTGVPGCQTCAKSGAGNNPVCKSCLDGYYDSRNGAVTCTACTGENCATCAKDTKDQCSTCKPGYFKQSDSPGTCTPCDDADSGIPGCATCTFSGSLACNSCKPNYKQSGSSPVTCTKTCEDETACGGTAGACDAIVINGSGEMTYYCSLCGASDKVPIDGKCVPSSSANGNTCAKGVCTQCTDGYFLYMGGCYKADQPPGNLMCTAAAGGICTITTSQYFKIPGATDKQQSVLGCGNPVGTAVGERAYVGVEGCKTCEAPTAATGMAAAKCTACDEGKKPNLAGTGCSTCSIAGCSACRADNMCEACTSSHYLKTEGSTTSCVLKEACTGGYFPKDESTGGNKCVQCSSASNGGITDCSECSLLPSTSRSSTPLITCTKCNGDKYLKDSTCVKKTECTETTFPKEDSSKGNKCLPCNDDTNGITDCAKCAAPSSAGQKPTCSECSNNKIVKTDKGITSCIEEADCTKAEGFFVKDGTPKTCVACNENCKTCSGAAEQCTSCKTDTLYLKKADGLQTGTCVDAAGCTNGNTHYADDTDPKTCKACAEGTFEGCETCGKSTEGAVVCKTCGSQKKIRPDKKGCIDACPPDVSTEKNGVCECVEGYAPSADGSSCASSSTNKSGLSTGAIAGISVAAVVVVGGLVGFLCWWFVCRGKA